MGGGGAIRRGRRDLRARDGPVSDPDPAWPCARRIAAVRHARLLRGLHVPLLGLPGDASGHGADHHRPRSAPHAGPGDRARTRALQRARADRCTGRPRRPRVPGQRPDRGQRSAALAARRPRRRRVPRRVGCDPEAHAAGASDRQQRGRHAGRQRRAAGAVGPRRRRVAGADAGRHLGRDGLPGAWRIGRRLRPLRLPAGPMERVGGLVHPPAPAAADAGVLGAAPGRTADARPAHRRRDHAGRRLHRCVRAQRAGTATTEAAATPT